MTGPSKARPTRIDPVGTRITAAVTLLIAAATVFWSSIHDLPFYTKGEPREAIVVQQMVARGDFIAPLRDRGEIASKPPLFHWLGALASSACGSVNETSVRLPSALASLVAIAATIWAGYQALGTAAGLAAGTILLTSQQWLQSSTAARVDMVLALALTTALLSLWKAWRLGRSEVALPFYLGCGAAVLAKGPVGYVLPTLVFGVALAARHGRPCPRLLPRRPGPALIALTVPLIWYLLAWYEIGQPFIDKVVFKENLYRVVDAEAAGTGHLAPWYYYVPALLGGMAPWSLLLPRAIYDLRRQRLGPADPGAIWFLAVWVVVTFVFFSLAGSKRAVYLLPAYPALALLLGCWLDRTARHSTNGFALSKLRRWLACAAGAGLITVALVLAGEVIGMPITSKLAPVMNPKDAANLAAIGVSLQNHKYSVLCWGAITGAAAWILARSIDRRQIWSAFYSAALVLVLAAIIGSTVLRDMARGNSLEPFMRDVARTVPATEPLSFYPGMKYLEYFRPAAVYYAERPISVGFETGASEPPERVWVLAGEPSPARICGTAASEGPPVVQTGFRCRTVLRHSFSGGSGRDPLYLIAATRESSHDHGE